MWWTFINNLIKYLQRILILLHFVHLKFLLGEYQYMWLKYLLSLPIIVTSEFLTVRHNNSCSFPISASPNLRNLFIKIVFNKLWNLACKFFLYKYQVYLRFLLSMHCPPRVKSWVMQHGSKEQRWKLSSSAFPWCSL